MTGDESEPFLGLCCTCGNAPACNIIMLALRAPEPGQGWGCVVCGLPADGAIAVLCNACVEQPIVKVCVGYPQEGLCCSIDDLSGEPFEHDETKHREED